MKRNELKEKIMDLITLAPNQRLRPNELEQTVANQFNAPRSLTSEVLKDLVEEGELVYTYRDPSSYLEFPCNGCEGNYHAARPMKVVTDANGEPWICDEDVNPDSNLPAQGCWSCGEVPFTRS